MQHYYALPLRALQDVLGNDSNDWLRAITAEGRLGAIARYHMARAFLQRLNDLCLDFESGNGVAGGQGNPPTSNRGVSSDEVDPERTPLLDCFSHQK